MSIPIIKLKPELKNIGVQYVAIEVEPGDEYNWSPGITYTTSTTIKIKIVSMHRNKKEQRLLNRFLRKMTNGYFIYPHKKRGDTKC